MATINFDVDVLFATKLLATIHFERDLKSFDDELLSTYQHPFTVKAPDCVIYAINKFLSKLDDELVKSVLLELFPTGATLDPEHAPMLLKALLSTQAFRDCLIAEQRETPVTDSYVWDDELGLEYYVKDIGTHSYAINAALQWHDLEDDEIDDFVMNKIKIKGYYNDPKAYDYMRSYSKRREPIDIQATALAFLDMAEEQAQKIENDEMMCFRASYGNDEREEYRLKDYTSWSEFLLDVLNFDTKLLPQIVEKPLFEQFGINDTVLDYTFLKRGMSHEYGEDKLERLLMTTNTYTDSYLDYVIQIPDIHRERNTFFVEAGSRS